MYVLNGFLSVTAVFGNASLIFALRKTSSIPSPTRTLLRFLAITDLTTGVLGHPLYIAVISKILQHYSCENVREILLAFFLIQASLTGCSFMVLTFIGVDRFLAIYLHLRYNELVTTKRIITVVLASWTFSLATISYVSSGILKLEKWFCLLLLTAPRFCSASYTLNFFLSLDNTQRA